MAMHIGQHGALPSVCFVAEVQRSCTPRHAAEADEVPEKRAGLSRGRTSSRCAPGSVFSRAACMPGIVGARGTSCVGTPRLQGLLDPPLGPRLSGHCFLHRTGRFALSAKLIWLLAALADCPMHYLPMSRTMP